MRSVLLALVTSGLAVAGLAALGSAAHAQPFVRAATPFPVAEFDEPVELPFLGGFSEPRPRVTDLDGDADPDLLVNVGGAGLQWLERTGAGPAGWTWRTDKLGGIEPGSWFAVGDLDGDGDADLLTRGAPGRASFWRNTGTAAAPAYELAVAELPAADGAPVQVEDSSQPDLSDIDADGDLDLFAGTTARGRVTYYRNDGLADGVPQFVLVTEYFEDIEVFAENPNCGGGRRGPGSLTPGLGGGSARHGANALALYDITGDGAPELFWGDFFAPSLVYFRNVGTPAAPDFQEITETYPEGSAALSGGYNAPAFGDLDGDADGDLLVGVQRGLCFQTASTVENLLYFENQGTPSDAAYALAARRAVETLDRGTRSTVALADLDGDGDLDAVVGNEIDPLLAPRATLALYRNEGTPDAPSLRLADADWLGLDYDFGGYGPTFGDLDGDGDLDLLVGGFNGRFAYLENTGSAASATFELRDDRWQGVDAGQIARASLGDLDGDGDLDLATGATNGRLRVYRNVGTAQEAIVPTEPNGQPTAADLAFAQAIGLPDDVGDDSAPAFHDLDGDGDLDLVVGTGAGALRVFRNVGTATAPAFAEEPEVEAGRRRTTPALGDLTGDGVPELLAGADSGGLLYWSNSAGTGAEAGPGAGLGFRVVPNPSGGSVAFETGDAVRATVVVFDARGREVARLPLDGRRAEWGGAGAAGEALPAGVYLAQLRDGRRVETVRFTRVR